jgi:glycosyltransferase involved in cell wall biosynthesis
MTPSIAPRYGGPAEVAIQLVTAQRRLGIDAQIYTLDLDGPNRLPVPVGCELVYRGVPITFFGVSQPRKFGTSWKYTARLAVDIKEFDMVHIHGLYLMPTYAASHAARWHGIPYILRPHGTFDSIQRQNNRLLKAAVDRTLGRRLIADAAAVHFTSEQEAFEASDVVPPSKRLVVALGAAKSHDVPVRPEWWPKAPVKVVLFFGRLAQKKRPVELLQAWSGITDSLGESWVLAVVGPDDYFSARDLEAKALDLGCAKSTIFPGMAVAGEKRFVLENSSIFVLPSRSENFGVAAAEALLHGLPAIISRNVAVSRIVAEAGAGFVLDDPSPEAIGGALLRWAVEMDDEQRREVSLRATAVARERLDWDSVAKDLNLAYENILRRPNNLNVRRSQRRCEGL